MLGAVLVAGDQAAADLAIVKILPLVVEFTGHRIKPLDGARADRRFVAQPDRCRDNQDMRRPYVLEHRRPVIGLPAMFGHVRVDPAGDIVVHGSQHLDRHAVALHDRFRYLDQPVRV